MNTAAPRPLNWLDARLLRLQRPGRPWTILHEATLTRPITTEELEAAMRRLVGQRPALAARLDEADLRWVPGPPPEIIDGERADHLDVDLDLTTASPLRVVRSGDGRRLSLLTNHAFADGMGALAIFDDLLQVIADPEALLSARPWIDDESLALAAPRFSLRGATDLLPSPSTSHIDAAEITALAGCVVALDPLRQRGEKRGTTMTTVVLAALHDVIAGSPWARRHTVIGLPVDLRRRFDLGAGLGNAVINANVRAASDNRDPVRGWQESLERQTLPSRIGGRLGLIRRTTRGGRPRTAPRTGSGFGVESAILSNLGRASRSDGRAVIDTLDFAPPAHGLVAVGVVGWDDELRLTVRARRPQTEVDDLAARLRQALSPSTPPTEAQ